jgi:acetyl esterase/lipase
MSLMRGPVHPADVRTVLLGAEILEESESYAASLLAASGEPIHRRDIQAHRDAALRNRVPARQADVSVSERSVSAAGQSVVIRQFLPAGRARCGYLHFHGGGWVFGAASVQDAELADLAHDLGIAVFSVEYRLAPEHPFPAALDDAETAARWLIAEGRQDLGLGLVAIGGESAGAHLAAAALQRLVAADELGAFAAANLLYGLFDLSMTPSQRQAEGTPRLSRPDLEWYYAKVMPFASAEDRRSAAVSPLYGELRDMPPARFAVGTLDPLLDDSSFMAARWAAAGSPATLEIYLAGAHGFARQPNGLGALAAQRQAAFLARHLNLTAALGEEAGNEGHPQPGR